MEIARGFEVYATAKKLHVMVWNTNERCDHKTCSVTWWKTIFDSMFMDVIDISIYNIF